MAKGLKFCQKKAIARSSWPPSQGHREQTFVVKFQNLTIFGKLNNRAFRNINGLLAPDCSFWVKIGKMFKFPKMAKPYVANLLHKTLKSIFSKKPRSKILIFTFLESPGGLVSRGMVEIPWTFFFYKSTLKRPVPTVFFF